MYAAASYTTISSAVSRINDKLFPQVANSVCEETGSDHALHTALSQHIQTRRACSGHHGHIHIVYGSRHTRIRFQGLDLVSDWRWDRQKSANYHNVLLESFYPFVYVIEPTVRVFAFGYDTQRDTCEQKDEEDFEEGVQGNWIYPSGE